MTPSTGTCTECKETKTFDNFYGGQDGSRRKARISKRCRSCRLARINARDTASANGERICGRCKVTKSIDGFSRNSAKYFSHLCNQCAREDQYSRRRIAGKPIREPQTGNEEIGFICNLCKVQKPISGFRRKHTGYWDYRCRDCNSKRAAAHASKPHIRFREAQKLATKRKLSWSLTFDQFIAISSRPCEYCGHQLVPTAIGIDRKDSRFGYSPDNSVPCCTECNIAKGPFWSYEEMLIIGQAIATAKNARLSSGIPESSRNWGGASHRH